MKVIHLLKTSVGATWALRQVRELARLGVEVHAVMPAGGQLVAAYRDAGATVHEAQLGLSPRQPRRTTTSFAALRDLVAQLDPDIIHSHFVNTTLSMRLALGKGHHIPRVFQVPGPLHLEHPVFRRLEIATAGEPDHWIGSCDWTCERYRLSHVPEDRIHLAYYGSDIDEFVPQSPGTLRAELSCSEDAPIVGMVAYMYAPKRYLGQRRGLKGHEDLIDAITLVQQRIPDVQAVFIGGAWAGAIRYEERVRQYGESRLGNTVHFLGTRSDVPKLYADMNAVVHPSHSENVGGAGESLLLGVPTIATDVGGFPDLVKPGKTGWLVPAKSPEALAEAIIDAVRNPSRASQMAESGRLHARDLMDVRKNAGDVLAIYERILAHR